MSQMSDPNADPPPWQVTGQRETTAVDDTGNYVPSVAVSVKLATGTVLTVTVPRSRYTADYVKAQIQAAVAHYAAVDGLSG